MFPMHGNTIGIILKVLHLLGHHAGHCQGDCRNSERRGTHDAGRLVRSNLTPNTASTTSKRPRIAPVTTNA
jgi:hypothetical protein